MSARGRPRWGLTPPERANVSYALGGGRYTVAAGCSGAGGAGPGRSGPGANPRAARMVRTTAGSWTVERRHPPRRVFHDAAQHHFSDEAAVLVGSGLTRPGTERDEQVAEPSLARSTVTSLRCGSSKRYLGMGFGNNTSIEYVGVRCGVRG